MVGGKKAKTFYNTIHGKEIKKEKNMERFIEIKLGNLKTPYKEFANLYEFMNYMKERNIY